MSHRQIARLVGGLLLAVVFLLLVLPTSGGRAGQTKYSCGSVLNPKTLRASTGPPKESKTGLPDVAYRAKDGGTVPSCKVPINNRVGVALVVGVLGVGAFIVASRLGESPSDRTSSSTGRAPKQPGTSTRQLDPPLISFGRGRTKAGEGPLGCSECGRGVPEAAKFCPHCGERFDDPSSCPNPNCDAKPSKNSRFCAECGWDLKAET
jgi:hypothetical protein